MKVLVTQLCLTLGDPMNCSLPVSSVHGILQARILEWVATPSPGDLPNLVIRTQVSCIAGRFFTIWATTSLELWANTPTTHYSVNREKHKGQSLGCSKCSSPGNDPNILLPSTSTFVLQAQFPEITPITWGSFPWYSLISISAVHQDFCYSSLADCLSAE